MPRFNLIKQMSASKAVIGLNMLRAVGRTRARSSRGSTRWATLIDDGTDPAGRRRGVPFDRAAEAHRMIAERRNVGKVVLTP